MNIILVPVDFSACADAAAAIAIEVAKKNQAQVYFLHLYRDTQTQHHVHLVKSSSSHEHPQNPKWGAINDRLNQLVKNAEASDVKASRLLVRQTGLEKIEDYIAPYRINLVVMGSHGVTGIRETILGSNTQRLIRTSPVPVLVIKSTGKNFFLKRVVFASSFGDDAASSFEPVMHLLKPWNSLLYLLYVNTPHHFKENREIVIQMDRFMKAFPANHYVPVVYNSRDEEDGIREFSAEHQVDLIVLHTYGMKGLYRLLSRGVAEKVINHEDIAVLVVNVNPSVRDGRQEAIEREHR